MVRLVGAWRPWGASVLWLLAACSVFGIGSTPSSGDDGDDGNSTSPLGSGTTSSASEAASGSGEDESTQEAESEEEGGFILQPDTHEIGCDQWEQDCPEGQKCTAIWWEQTSGWWDSNVCRPVHGDDQLGEPCDLMGYEYDGHDSCAAGLICLGGYSQGSPVCEAFCSGSPGEHDCGPDGTCQLFNGGVATFCLRRCNPLDPTTCGDLEACEFHPHAYPSGIVCDPHLPGSMPVGSECWYYASCDWGAVCWQHSGCEKGFCCTQACDLDAPDCDDPLATCVNTGNEAPYEHGLCLVQ